MIVLKNVLDKFYSEYDFKGRLLHDPIEFPHRYKNPRDIEVSAFIASSLAYGKVELFKPIIEKILAEMGPSPYEFLLGFSIKRHRKLFEGIKYRFNENEDLMALLFILHETLSGNTKEFISKTPSPSPSPYRGEGYKSSPPFSPRRIRLSAERGGDEGEGDICGFTNDRTNKSLENVFMKFYRVDSPTIEEGLAGFVASFLQINTSPVYGKDIKPAGLRQLFPSPVDGSACKRANLFLRWMVRDRDIDFGIWKGIPKKNLVIPLDTHIARISRCLGFTERKSPGWKMAVEITESLKRFDPEDPLKYDFALCHHGISGMCKGEKNGAECKGCMLKRS